MAINLVAPTKHSYTCAMYHDDIYTIEIVSTSRRCYVPESFYLSSEVSEDTLRQDPCISRRKLGKIWQGLKAR